MREQIYENWFISKGIRISKIASGAEYQMDEKFQNLPIFKAKFRLSESEKF